MRAAGRPAPAFGSASDPRVLGYFGSTQQLPKPPSSVHPTWVSINGGWQSLVDVQYPVMHPALGRQQYPGSELPTVQLQIGIA